VQASHNRWIGDKVADGNFLRAQASEMQGYFWEVLPLGVWRLTRGSGRAFFVARPLLRPQPRLPARHPHSPV